MELRLVAMHFTTVVEPNDLATVGGSSQLVFKTSS